MHKLYPEGSGQAAAAMTGAEFLDQLASRPLLYQPGAVWDYGFGLDVLGLVIEQLTEQSLGSYLQAERLEAARHGRYRLPRSGRQGRPLRQARCPTIRSAAIRNP